MTDLAEPKQFKELCELVGIAVLMGQKVQFALAHYYATYHMVHSDWSKATAKESISHHLSKPMGAVVTAIERDAHPGADLLQKINAFKEQRNWLVHDFDEEATPYLVQGQRFPEYAQRMEEIYHSALDVMKDLDVLGETLIPARG